MMKHVIFDLYGVLFRDAEVAPHAIETTQRLRADGCRLAFLTNNSSRHRRDVAAHLVRLGFRAEEDEVLTSASAAALHIRARYADSAAFVIGEAGLISELEEQGIRVITDERDAGLVVVGWDRSLTYDKLKRAHQAIMAGAVFVATNEDRSFPMGDGRTSPGAGAIVAALITSTGIEPVRIGKPLPTGMRMIAEGWGVSPDHLATVGDRLETDIAASRAFGARSILVLTGVTSREEGEAATGNLAPDVIIDDLSQLAEALR